MQPVLHPICCDVRVRQRNGAGSVDAAFLGAMARITTLKAVVMAQPQEDHCSAGLGASNDTVVYAERSRNFGDCSGGFHDGEVEMASDVMHGAASPTMPGLLHDVQAASGSDDAEMSVEPAALSNCRVVTEMIGTRAGWLM